MNTESQWSKHEARLLKAHHRDIRKITATSVRCALNLFTLSPSLRNTIDHTQERSHTHALNVITGAVLAAIFVNI